MSLWVIVFLLSTVTLSFQTCSNSNSCECAFDDESAFKSKSEILAAAVGALCPLVAVGGGFGIWKLIQGNKSDAGSSSSREGSDLSDRSTRKSGSASPATNSTRSDSRISRNTPIPINTMDLESERDFSQSPTPTDDPRWSQARRPPPPLTNRIPLSEKSDNLNSWMF